MRIKIGDLAHRWMVHPRKGGDLVLTSEAGIAVVDTRNKRALTGSTLKGLASYQDRNIIALRQDVVDRLLDAESQTKASHLPMLKIDMCGLGIAVIHLASL